MFQPNINLFSLFVINRSNELNFLSFFRSNFLNQIGLPLNGRLNSSKHLFEVFGNIFDVFCVSDDFEQIVISNEVKPRKKLSLFFQVILKWFLDQIQRNGKNFKLFDKVLFLLKNLKSIWIFMGKIHQIQKVSVNLSKLPKFVWKLRFDVLVANEDWLQVNPLSLDLKPKLKNLS